MEGASEWREEVRALSLLELRIRFESENNLTMYNRPRSALGVQTQRHPVSTGRPRQRTAEEGGGREEVYLSRVWDKAASQELAQLLDMRGYEAEAVVGSQRRAYPQVRSRPTTASSARKRGRDAKLSLFTSSNGFMGGSTFSPSSSPNRNRPQSSIQVGRRRGRGGGPASPHHDHRFEDSDQQPWNVHNFRNVLSAAPASSADARQLAETLTNELTKVFPRSKGGRLSSECFTRKDKLEALRNAYGSCMKELVRQLKVRSTPQGELLETIWKNYVSMLEEIVMHSQVKRDIENWSLWEKRNGGTKPPQQPLKSIQGLKVAPKVLASPSVGATLDKGRVLTSKVRPKMRRSSTTGSSFKAGAGSLLAKLNGVSNSKPGTPAPAISAAANRFRLLASMGGGLRSSASAQLSSGVVSRDLLNAAKVALDQIESIKKLREMTFIEESKKANKRQGGLRIPVKGDPKHKQKQLANYWRRKLSMGLAKPTKILAGGPHKMRRTRTLQDAAITIQACWRMSEAKAEVDARRRAELKNLTRASFLSQMQATVRCIEEEREKERIRAERSNELNSAFSLTFSPKEEERRRIMLTASATLPNTHSHPKHQKSPSSFNLIG